MSARELPAWRSLLYVPANVERFVARAHERGADAILLDLEDSVAAAEKDAARRAVQPAAERVGRGGADVLVRINRPWRLAVRDLEASVSPRVRGVVVTKAASLDHLRMVDEVISELEAERGVEAGRTAVYALVETPDAFLRAREIAGGPRVVAIGLGTEDFSVATGFEVDGPAQVFPNQQIVIAARAAGVLPLGLVGSLAGYGDADAFRDLAVRSRRLGFVGASAIHPSQVPIINQAFSPSDEEVAHARRVVEAYDAAVAAGSGAIEVDGRMVDVPVADRARALLARHEAIAARRRGG